MMELSKLAIPFKILLVRPENRSENLKKKLEKSGAKVWVFPSFFFQNCSISPPIQEALHSLNDFEWLFFGSSKAIETFQEFLNKINPSFGCSKNSSLKIGVVGKKSKAKFCELFPNTKVSLQKNNLQELLQTIPNSTSKIKILNPTSVQGLEKISLQIPPFIHLQRIPFYETLINKKITLEEIKKNQSRKYDLVFWGSPTAFDYSLQLLGKKMLSKIPIKSVFGKTTKKYMENQGFPITIMPKIPDENLLCKAIFQYIRMADKISRFEVYQLPNSKESEQSKDKK